MSIPVFDVTPFLHQDEGQHFERKSLFEGLEGAKRPRERRAVRDQVAEYVAGFANAEGGILILGIEDDHTVTGHNLPDDALATLLTTPRSRLLPPQPAGFLIECDGKPLIVFDVPSSDVPVQVAGDGFPLRIGDKTIQASETHIRALKLQGLAESWESRLSKYGMDDLDGALLARARHGAGLAAWTDEDYLLKRKLADRRGDRIQLRRAAELLFARLGPDHPNAGVRVFRVIGTERRTGPEHNVEERPRIEGNLPAVIEDAFDSVGGLLRRPSRLVGTRFRPVPEYPEFSWKEALLNAVAHRDYSIEGSGTEIWLFDDRLEIVSPGGLPGDLTLDEVLSLKRIHHSRNPRVMRTLVDLGVARDQGEGIPRMFAEMVDAFLPTPRIDTSSRSVRVTLQNTPTLTSSDRAFVARLGSIELSNDEFRALLHAQRHGRVENADLRLLAGVDTLNASLLLRRLRDRSLLDLHPHGANSFYTLPEALLRDADRGELVADRGELIAERGELATDRGERAADRGELVADRGERAADQGERATDRGELLREVVEAIARLGVRPRSQRLREVIALICRQRDWTTPAELARWLQIKPENLTTRHLSPMVESGELERRFPDKPTHAEQAYRAPRPSLIAPREHLL